MAMGFDLVKQNVTSSALDPTSTLSQEEISICLLAKCEVLQSYSLIITCAAMPLGTGFPRPAEDNRSGDERTARFIVSREQPYPSGDL